MLHISFFIATYVRWDMIIGVASPFYRGSGALHRGRYPWAGDYVQLPIFPYRGFPSDVPVRYYLYVVKGNKKLRPITPQVHSYKLRVVNV